MNIAVKIEADAEAAAAMATPLAEINPGRPDRFQNDTLWPYFERLRKEDPIHLTENSEFGRYWSITRWEDILAVDTNHQVFSSAEGIGLPNVEVLALQRKLMGDGPRRGAGFSQ